MTAAMLGPAKKGKMAAVEGQVGGKKAEKDDDEGRGTKAGKQ